MKSLFTFKIFFLVFMMQFTICLSSFGQEIGQTGLAFHGSFAQPLAGLSNWFEPTAGIGISFGQQKNDKWYLEGLFEFTRFDKENLSGYPAGKLQLSLEHYGLLVNGRYEIFRTNSLKPYLNVGVGVYKWKGVRGEILADSTVTPYVPYVDEKKLEEMNWGFRFGAGMEFCLRPSLSLDVSGYYRFIVGDLWPTLQPQIELDGVSGFQTLNMAVGIRYYF